MANIDLTHLFKNNNNKLKSRVDSDIKLSHNLGNNKIYSDIKLDLTLSAKTNAEYNSDIINYDLEKIANEESVLNSLKNILNTRYCSRLLNPEMNFDLRSYLFENLSESKAYFIGYDISNMLPYYEPRIKIKDISVVVYYGDDTYGVYLNIQIPSLNKAIKLSSILSSEGFSF